MKFLGYQSESYGEGFDVFLRTYLITWKSKGLIDKSTKGVCEVWLDKKPDWKEEESEPMKTERKDPTFLELFKHNEERMNRFFELLKSDMLNAIDNDENWVYNTRKSSIVACFEALEELQYIKKFKFKIQLQRIVSTRIKFEATDKLFRNNYNPDDYDEFYRFFKK